MMNMLTALDKTVVLKEIDVDRYAYELMDFENDCHAIREEGFFVYVKLTPKDLNRDGLASYRYWRCFDEMLPNLDFENVGQWHIKVIDYLVFVDGDKTKVLKNRFVKDQKMVIVS